MNKQKLNAKTTGAHLKKFYELVDNISIGNPGNGDAAVYHKAALQATNDRGNRADCGHIIQKILSQ
jgi:hypothetical protein